MIPTALFLMTVVAAQPQRPGPADPLPNGQRIEARDGDTIVLRTGARIRVIQRSEATIRAVYNAADRWLVLIADYVDPATGAPDGRPDATYHYSDVDGVWPLGDRWQGSAVIDEYSMVQGPLVPGIGLTVEGHSIQVLRTLDSTWLKDSRATALLTARGSMKSTPGGGAGQRTFDDVEARAIADATRNTQNPSTAMTTFTGPGSSVVTSRTGTSVSSAAGVPSQPPPPPSAPVRVGGNIAQPRKIVDARPVMSAEALQAGIRGVVIVEIVIDADGSVRDAKVLRSVPLLNQAALDAVRQWRYEPTQLNGQAVPVIMTVTVAFP